MEDLQKKLNLAYKASKLFKIEIIRNEIEPNLHGYSLQNIEFKSGEWLCSYIGENNNHITLTFSFNNIWNIRLQKYTDNIVEKITIDKNLVLFHRTIDKREKGLIYSIIKKQFEPSELFNNQTVLVDLIEQRYSFKKRTIEFIMGNIDLDNYKLMHLLEILNASEIRSDLKEKSDYYTEFSTHMNYYVNWDGGRKIKDNIYPTRTYLNQHELSNIYDIDGADKLYRIFDLYRGIINPRNEKDINSIHLGLLSPDIYDLKSLKGITEQEDLIVGKPQDTISEEYMVYLKQMLDDKFGYKGDLTFDRESILSGILYQMSGPEIAKRNIERTLGISYSEFEKLDLNQQHKLIEEKTGKKLKPDYRLRIDGIPIDDDHIITEEQANKRIDELKSSGPKKLLKIFINCIKKQK